MIKQLAAVALVTAALSAPAVAQQWYPIATSDSAAFDVRAGSFALGNNDDGVPVGSISARVRAKDKSVLYRRFYVPIAHCQAGQGLVVTMEMDGRYLRQTSFVLGGDNVASGIADAVCYATAKASAPDTARY